MPFRTPFNVVAAFDQETTARSAADLLVRQGVPSSALRVRARGEGDGDHLAEERADMQDELVESWPPQSEHPRPADPEGWGGDEPGAASGA